MFNFEVMSLETTCGRLVVDSMLEDYNLLLVGWILDLNEKNFLLNTIDHKLNGEYNKKEMRELMMVGLWCSNIDFT
jgi:hypothetical protein